MVDKDTNVPNKNDYISREAAIELLDWYQHQFAEIDDYLVGLNREMRNLPAADVRPVVQCSACKHYFADPRITGICQKYGLTASPEWFCADGEYETNCGADMKEGKQC